jgi:hypothetical protein
MAVPTGTLQTFSTVGIREDLEDVIYDLFPEDTWAVTNLDKVDAQQNFHEWLTDDLTAAAANRQIEGDDATYATPSQPTRMGNYVQKSTKTFIISGETEAVVKAGRRSEIARIGMKSMVELKRDMELALVGNQASSAGGAGTARSSAGMESMIGGPTAPGAYTTTAGNAIAATTTAASATTIGFASGVFAAPTDGTTTGALTAQVLDDASRLAWQAGGNPKIMLVGAKQKAAINGLTGIAQRQVQVNAASSVPILGSASIYVNDFGTFEVVLSRYVRSSVVLVLDQTYWALAYLRRPFMEPRAKTGDAEKREMITNFCLVGRNPRASAKVVAAT